MYFWNKTEQVRPKPNDNRRQSIASKACWGAARVARELASPCGFLGNTCWWSDKAAAECPGRNMRMGQNVYQTGYPGVPNMLEKWTSHEQPWSPAILQFTNWFNRFWPMAALWCQDVTRWSPISRPCGAFPCISDVAVIPIRWSGTTILILVPLHNGPNNERRIPLAVYTYRRSEISIYIYIIYICQIYIYSMRMYERMSLFEVNHILN